MDSYFDYLAIEMFFGNSDIGNTMFYKLPGAGGGGYLYMVAKDPEAAARIKRVLAENRQHPNARFVDMSLSNQGLQVSRS